MRSHNTGHCHATPDIRFIRMLDGIYTLPYISFRLPSCSISFISISHFFLSQMLLTQHGYRFHIYHSAATGDRLALWCIYICSCTHCYTLSDCTSYWYSQCYVTRTFQFQATTPVVLHRPAIDLAFCLHTTASSAPSVIS